jgi:hypothetical protein
MTSGPNFFVVGAPKCGTTSLARYLSEHPSIFVCDPKEPSYFARELIDMRQDPAAGRTPWRYDEHAYLKLFDAARPEQVAIGEASTTYLYSRCAPGAIQAFAPEARIIVMLRDPVELAHALHAQKLSEGEETVYDFEAAWRLQEKRKQGRGYTRPPLRPTMLLYGDVACIGAQLQRWLTHFPPARVKVILYDEFVAMPAGIYGDVLRFLDVPDDGRRDFPVYNRGRTVSNRWLHRAATWRFGALLEPYRFLRDRFGLDIGAKVRERMWRASSSDEPRDPISEAFERELQEYFAKDVDLLERLLGRSLEAWHADDHADQAGNG